MTNKNKTHRQSMKGDYLVNEIDVGKVFCGIFLQSLADNSVELARNLPKNRVGNIN